MNELKGQLAQSASHLHLFEDEFSGQEF